MPVPSISNEEIVTQFMESAVDLLKRKGFTIEKGSEDPRTNDIDPVIEAFISSQGNSLRLEVTAYWDVHDPMEIAGVLDFKSDNFNTRYVFKKSENRTYLQFQRNFFNALNRMQVKALEVKEEAAAKLVQGNRTVDFLKQLSR